MVFIYATAYSFIFVLGPLFYFTIKNWEQKQRKIFMFWVRF
jgi:hypothetical protein